MKHAIAIVLLLGGCSSGTIVKERVQRVNVPVAQECATERPDKVTTLKQDYTDAEWSAMDARQKAAAVGRKGLERLAYGESLDAATGACK